MHVHTDHSGNLSASIHGTWDIKRGLMGKEVGKVVSPTFSSFLSPSTLVINVTFLRLVTFSIDIIQFSLSYKLILKVGSQ